jgi:ribonuclease HI
MQSLIGTHIVLVYFLMMFTSGSLSLRKLFTIKPKFNQFTRFLCSTPNNDFNKHSGIAIATSTTTTSSSSSTNNKAGISREWSLYCTSIRSSTASKSTDQKLAASSAILYYKNREICASANYWGESVTASQAKFYSLISGLKLAHQFNVSRLAVFSDSKSLSSMLDSTCSSDGGQQMLFNHVVDLLSEGLEIEFSIIKKSENERAISLCDEALKSKAAMKVPFESPLELMKSDPVLVESGVAPLSVIALGDEIVKSSSSKQGHKSDREKWELFFDGGSRGNPGISGSGAVLYKDGTEIWSAAKFLGRHNTNNQAEYTGLIIGA